MRDALTLKRAAVVGESPKAFTIEADCIVNGTEEKTFRFSVPKSQSEVDDSTIQVARWIIEQRETEIVTLEAKRGNVYSSVGIMVLEED